MENERKWTVYIHRSPSRKYYIGITSLKPEYRWNGGNGYIHNKYFYRAITKYGWDNLEHIIFRENLTAKEAKRLEIKLIAYFKSNDREYGYNITAGGDGVNGLKHTKEAKKKMSEARSGENNHMYGKHHSEETRRKISEARKGKCTGENNPNYRNHFSEETRKKMSQNHFDCSGENHPQAKAVICIDINKYYKTAKEAAEKTNTCYTCITAAARGKRKTAGGYHWRYATENEIEEHKK